MQFLETRDMPSIGLTRAGACAAIVTAWLGTVVPAAHAQSAGSNLARMSIEDLLQIEVTSASKKEQALSEAASAIHVLTRDDLDRAGVTTVAEALRLVPGLQVARIDANKWAVSSRGFNGRFANKMLVLIDGRSVYTPLFSGVYWDVQDLPLADIDRIEVIRGPGAALWGANAVNGVINVITLPAAETGGADVALTTGTDEQGIEARYGDALADGLAYRVFVKHAAHDAFANADGADSADDWGLTRAGGRLDWQRSADERFTIDGAAYVGDSGQTYALDATLPSVAASFLTRTDVGGGHVLGRWTRTLSERADVTLQAYVDRTTRRETGQVQEERTTMDVEFQHHAGLGSRHDVVWGAGFRSTADALTDGATVRFSTDERRDNLTNLFIQDEIVVRPGRLRVTLGTKLEHNAYTGWEVQPDVRALVVLSPRQTLWAAVSRAVRTPSRAERDVEIDTSPVPGPGGLLVVSTLYGSPAFRSETLRAHEVGYRVAPHAMVSFDVAGFYNAYDHLRTFEPGTPTPALTPAGPILQVPLLFANGMEGTAAGAEVIARWTPAADWRLEGAYTFLDLTLRHKPTSADTLGIVVEDDSPRHQARVAVNSTFGGVVDVGLSAAYTAELIKQQIPGYTRVDARLAWRIRPALTLAAGVRNLGDARHREFASTLGELPTETRRSLFAQLRVRF
jgi:iron complex outermembrane receptor protein